jgi:hypothetical protein
MMFFVKNKKVVVDCFTYVDVAYDFFKIRKALRYYPEIIKKMDPFVIEGARKDPRTNISITTPTIKMCTGLNLLYKHGAIMPFWTDVKICPKSYLSNQSSIAMTEPWYQEKIHEHPKEQFAGMMEGYTHIKFIGVWNIQEKNGIKFTWNPAFWNMDVLNKNLLIPPGVTFYDNQCQTNINAFVRNDADDFILKAGTPLIHITPLTEKEVEYKCHLVSYEEWIKKNQITLTYPNFVPGLRWNRVLKDRASSKEMDRLDAAENRKCPFGFGK